jgi:SAM-dependent methyltransferase
VCHTIEEYLEFVGRSAPLLARITEFEDAMLASRQSDFPGLCAVCNKNVRFSIERLSGGQLEMNWRETFACPRCGLNNRSRLSTHFLLSSGVERDTRIYLTEQATALYRQFKRLFPSVVGSEYEVGGTPGECGARGWRHEDITRLSFDDAELDCICTFDVLEHVPDYAAGLSECLRCLRLGGRLLMTVPFGVNDRKTLIRARVDPTGSIEHLHPPVYHNDPLSLGGILCFQEFGWDLLDLLRDLGLEDPALHFFWSPDLAYLGGPQFVISGVKATGSAGESTPPNPF